MTTTYLNTDDEGVKLLASLTFPSYHGKKFRAVTIEGPIHLENYWSGGSKKTWIFIQLSNMSVAPLGGAMSNPLRQDAHQKYPIPKGYVGVCHSVFQGKDMGLTFYVHPENMSQLLPAPQAQAFTRHERIVLCATRTLKASYGGIKNVRWTEAHRYTKITLEEWETAKASLIEKGLLQKNGAITPEGRNASGNTDLFHFHFEEKND